MEVLRRTPHHGRSPRTAPSCAAASRSSTSTGARPGFGPAYHYYYELTARPASRCRHDRRPTAGHRHDNRRLRLRPHPLRRAARACTAATTSVTPPATAPGRCPRRSPVNGQLRRLVELFGAAADHLRSRADGLRDLHDVDESTPGCCRTWLGWLGWDLTAAAPIPVQRHEIRYAAQLYRITGTLPGCMLWVKRLTGWDVEVQEFWRNVLVTNDLGNPTTRADRGSRTVDTADAGADGRARHCRRPRSTTRYETGPQARHAFNVVSFHATPDAGRDAGRDRAQARTAADRLGALPAFQHARGRSTLTRAGRRQRHTTASRASPTSATRECEAVSFSNGGVDTFDERKSYIGVRLQQGVPLLDRDWNELEDIRRYLERMLRRHYIGEGVPDLTVSRCPRRPSTPPTTS